MSNGYEMVILQVIVALEPPITMDSNCTQFICYSFCSCSWNSLPLQRSASTSHKRRISDDNELAFRRRCAR